MMVSQWQSVLHIFSVSGILLMILLTIMVQESEGRARKSCGSDLADRIATVCNGEYNELYWSDSDSHTRVRRGIVDECCKNRCSDSRLRSQYCQTKDDSARVADDSSVYVSKEEHPPEELKKSLDEPIIPHSRLSPTPEIGTVAPEYNLRGMIPPQYRTQDIRFH
ncbi:insulin-like growth factor II isoform X2 [Phlebotomus papatasi]|nr:insulin-like growth factor II isoform X2 [Phlebotomus papatasi]